MKSNYKRLGDFIKSVNNRNIGLVSTDLRGLSMSKEFRESTSNIVGTDLSNYKLVNKYQFACDFMSVIRVHKLPVVLHIEDSPVIVSPAYVVFEVKDKNKLDPEYLMMWFRRPEFDRYADFRCDSAIRGGFKWDELCDVELPIPSIEKQRAIVSEYNTVVNRIQLNEQLIQKLEETAQAIYKRWFVDFEFPSEAHAKDGVPQPYKSSGGKMVWNEELEKEIPEGWVYGCLDDLSSQFSGFSFKGEDYSFEEGITVVRGENVTEKRLRWDTHKKWNLELDLRMKKCYLAENDIVIGMDGSKVGKNWSMISPFELPLLLAQRVTSVRGTNSYDSFYIFLSLLVLNFEEYVSQVQTGTSVPHISGQQIKEFPLLSPSKNVLIQFDKLVRPLFEKIYLNIETEKKLEELKEFLLSQMTKVEGTTEKEMI